MAFGYRYALERQENGWWLVRFPKVPEALTEGESEDEALSNSIDALVAALEGYIKAGRAIPLGDRGEERVVLPSLVTAKLAVYCAMKELGWTRQRLADALNMRENAVRRLLNLRHSSQMWIIDEAMAKMKRQLNIELTSRYGPEAILMHLKGAVTLRTSSPGVTKAAPKLPGWPVQCQCPDFSATAARSNVHHPRCETYWQNHRFYRKSRVQRPTLTDGLGLLDYFLPAAAIPKVIQAPFCEFRGSIKVRFKFFNTWNTGTSGGAISNTL